MLQGLSEERQEMMWQYLNIKHADFFVKHFGSLNKMNQHRIELKNEYDSKIESKKFVVDLFCKTFFGVCLFDYFKKF